MREFITIMLNYIKVLSETVASALESNYGEEVQETVKFIRMMDKFFDCFNVTNNTTGYHSLKSFKDPYCKPDDFRLKVCRCNIVICGGAIVLHYNQLFYPTVA